jgi:hypothetical protein
MGVSDQLASLAIFFRGEEPTLPNCVGGRLGHRAGLDALDKTNLCCPSKIKMLLQVIQPVA